MGKLLARPLRGPYSKLLEIWCRSRGRRSRQVATTFWGERMNVVFPDRVSVAIYRYGFFEEDMTHALLGYLKPGMTFFDVGSHIGFFSLLASAIVGPRGRVVAFEPTPSSFEIVSGNLAHLANCRCENVAAFREDTHIEFTDFGVEFSVFNSMYGGKIKNDDLARATPRTLKVMARALDRWCAETGIYPDFLKIDTEGAEMDVLAGCNGILRSRRPMFTLEVGDIEGAQDKRPSRVLVDAALGLGYRSLEWRNGSFVEHRPRDTYEYTNLLFVPA